MCKIEKVDEKVGGNFRIYQLKFSCGAGPRELELELRKIYELQMQ